MFSVEPAMLAMSSCNGGGGGGRGATGFLFSSKTSCGISTGTD